LPGESVDKFHIYFPDPWPKSKHRKRRFLKQPMLDEVDRCLKPGGSIYFASDIFDYFFQVKILTVLHQGLEITQEMLPDEVFTSMYSRKMKDAGKKINALVIKKSKS
jgi:tRNA (guanine-N7-)-methyltransferase